MGVALGWLAFALTGVAAAPPSDRENVEITYTVRMVETEGLGSREGVLPRLKPVTRQGAATIWTLPKDAVAHPVERSLQSRGQQGDAGARGHRSLRRCRDHPVPQQSTVRHPGRVERNQHEPRGQPRLRSRRLAHHGGGTKA